MLTIPKFWHKEKRYSFMALALNPLGLLYGKIVSNRANKTNGYNSKLPVICIGNITMGGAGKTPMALALAKILREDFHKNIAFLTRGYGGSIQQPTRVLDTHTASECGDEPLLLSRIAPTYVSPDRGKGAILMEQFHNDQFVIILDDGMQNPTLKKDLTFVVIDGRFGLGNQRLFPAGALRETLKSAESRASAFIIVGEDQSNISELISKTIQNPLIIQAHIKAEKTNANQDVILFAGIGMPGKVFRTALEAGYNLIETKSYGDHYNYTQSDLSELSDLREKHHAKLLTTSKDYARLPQDFINKHQPLILEIELTFSTENKKILTKLLKNTFSKIV